MSAMACRAERDRAAPICIYRAHTASEVLGASYHALGIKNLALDSLLARWLPPRKRGPGTCEPEPDGPR